MMFITGDERTAFDLLSKELISELDSGRKVLWLVSGGSNIHIAAATLEKVKNSVPKKFLGNLYVTLTDERYGPIGHKDSNWQQLSEAGFNFSIVNSLPVLANLSLEQTVNKWSDALKEARLKVDVVLGQFGMGRDGHIAGALPQSDATTSKSTVSFYKTPEFTRITITPFALKDIDIAYCFAFGAEKRQAVSDLKDKDLPIEKEPVQILKNMKEAYFVSDMI